MVFLRERERERGGGGGRGNFGNEVISWENNEEVI